MAKIDSLSKTSQRRQLLRLLQGKGAHMTFEEAVKYFPTEDINLKPPNIPYTPWRLLEHLRITQGDILDYIKNPNYKYLKWPQEYWPLKKNLPRTLEKDYRYIS